VPTDDPHLKPERFGALAAGENPAGSEGAHLERCAECRSALARARVTLNLLETPDLDEVTARRAEGRLLRRVESAALRPAPRARRSFGSVAVVLGLVGAAAVLTVTALVRGDETQAPKPSPSAADGLWPAAPSPQCRVPPPSPADAWLAFEMPATDPPIASEPAPDSAPRPARSERVAPLARKAEAPRATVAQGETTVTRRPPGDPFFGLLFQGRQAHADGRHAKADSLATRARALAGTQAQRLSAWQLACESRIADRRPEAAVAACEHLLAHPNPERVRTTHFMLGTLHRAQLQDCAQAIVHYGQALVFGVPSLYTQEALRFRAECELELGRLDAAEADLARLQAQPGLVSRWEEVEALQLRLRQAREAASRMAPAR